MTSVEAMRNRCRRPLFIHFFGADGVGKTTQGRMLVHRLKKMGVDTKLVRIRSGRTFASLVYQFLKWLKSDQIQLGEDGRVIRIYLMKGNPHRQIWCLLEFMSMIPWLLRGVFIPLSVGRVVVAERYIIDAIATLAYLVDNPVWPRSYLAKTMLRFIPNNTIFIHLDAPYSVIAERKGSSIDPRSYIEFQRKTYNDFARALGAFTIDTTSLSVPDTHGLILNHLICRCPRD